MEAAKVKTGTFRSQHFHDFPKTDDDDDNLYGMLWEKSSNLVTSTKVLVMLRTATLPPSRLPNIFFFLSFFNLEFNVFTTNMEMERKLEQQNKFFKAQEHTARMKND